MEKAIRLLLVEDSDDDATLVLRELRRAGFTVESERVQTASALRSALATRRWDLVICDYSMPEFSAPAALETVKESGHQLPFIIVSGTIGEDAAVAVLKAGAHDFLLKDRLGRLPLAVERELRDARHRSERRKMQEQIVLSERMVSVGTLAAGVAHEINNPLAAVLVNLEYIEGELERLEGIGADAKTSSAEDWAAHIRELGEPLRDAKNAADRVRQIVRDLKLFSRPDEEHVGPVDVRRVLDSSLRMTENEVRHRARVVRTYEEVPPVEANESRLGQVFLNLLVNAAQAMPEGHADKNEIRLGARRIGDRVVVEIGDTGVGISENLLPHIFEPFVTTKPVGVGTGLGLAICSGIIAGLGGEISVRSKSGEGTVFRVELPVSARSYDEEVRPLRSVERAARARARVLAVDDDAMVGVAIARMLASDHEVTVLTDARAALELVSRGMRFDVILCNVMMPNMSGPDLYARLGAVAPEMLPRVVFMTGGAFTHAARAFMDSVDNRRIDKPFDAPELRRIVAEFASERPASET